MRRRSESELTLPVARYFHRKGYRWQTTELQFYEYNIDIYGFSRTANLTVSIELKIKNWRRAFQQALVYQLCSDLVLMALPQETVHRVDRNLLEAEGIGLLSVHRNNRCQVILRPRPSPIVCENYKRRNIRILKQVKGSADDRC